MSWPSVALSELTSKIGSGATPRGGQKAYKTEGTPLVRSMNVHNGQFKEDGLAFIDDSQSCALQNVELKKGDVLLNITGASVARSCRLPDRYAGGRVNQHVAIIRPRTDLLSPAYLEYFLTNNDTKATLLRIAGAGATREAITKTAIENFEIPLPPLDEQKRIAAILDQADALRRLRARTIERLNTLGQSIFYEMFGDPKTNPKNITTKQLGEIIKVSSGAGLTAKNMRPGPYPVYGGNGINGWHDEARVDQNTVIIGRVGVYCGAVHVTKSDAWVTDNALIVSKKQNIGTTYLAAALTYANLNQYAGRSAQPLVSGSRIYPVEILVPSNDQQLIFEEKIDTSRSHAKLLRLAGTTHENLFSSLQQRGFRGEL